MESRSPRHKVTLFMAERPEGPPFGVTRDVSRTGMYVVTEHRPALHGDLALYCVWGDDRVACDVKVIRHGDDGVGISFIRRSDLLDYALAQLVP